MKIKYNIEEGSVDVKFTMEWIYDAVKGVYGEPAKTVGSTVWRMLANQIPELNQSFEDWAKNNQGEECL